MDDTNGKKNTETTPLKTKKKTPHDYMKVLSSLDVSQYQSQYVGKNKEK